jgi:hypothetical protein
VPAGGEQAWRDIRTAQKAFQDSGVVHPWAFARLVRQLHRALAGEPETLPEEQPMTEGERQSALFNLSIGPCWEIGQTAVSDDHPDPRLRGTPRWALPSWGYDEEQLREFWNSWAADAKVWGETDWCFHRFARKLSPARAEAATEKARKAEDDRRTVERLAETGIRRVDDPFLRGRSPAEAARLIRAAGLEPGGV